MRTPFCLLLGLTLLLYACGSETQGVESPSAPPDPCHEWQVMFDTFDPHVLANDAVVPPEAETTEGIHEVEEHSHVDWQGDRIAILRRTRFSEYGFVSMSYTFTGQTDSLQMEMLQCIHQSTGVFGDYTEDHNGYWYHLAEADTLPSIEWHMMDESFEFGQPQITLLFTLPNTNVL